MVDLLGPRNGDTARSEHSKLSIRVKRVYEPPSPEDGTRVLVGRLWPRGLRKADAAIDCLLKETAPAANCAVGSATIRAAGRNSGTAIESNCRPIRSCWTSFAPLAAHDMLTLVYAAHDKSHNQAVALRGMLLP